MPKPRKYQQKMCELYFRKLEIYSELEKCEKEIEKLFKRHQGKMAFARIPDELADGERKYVKLELKKQEEPFFKSVKVNLNELKATRYKRRPAGCGVILGEEA